MKRTRRTTRAAAILGTLALAATPAALADPPAEDTPPAAPAPLAGPQVDDNAPPGARGTFGEPQRFGRMSRMTERPTPARLFNAALAALADATDDADRALAPTPEQTDTIEALMRDFQDQRRAFREQHAEEIRELVRTLRPDRPREPRADRRPRPNRQAQRDLSEDQLAARERLREIRAETPDASALQERIWIVLNDEQQRFVEAFIEERTTQARDRTRTRRGERGPAAESESDRPRAEQARRTAGPDAAAERLYALRNRLERLTPQQRERVGMLIDRLIERIDRQLEAQDERAAPPEMDRRRFFRNR